MAKSGQVQSLIQKVEDQGKLLEKLAATVEKLSVSPGVVIGLDGKTNKSIKVDVADIEITSGLVNNNIQGVLENIRNKDNNKDNKNDELKP